MSESHPTRLSMEDLEAEVATALPAKEVISLLNLNVDLDLALDLAAPIDLAIAANANVAAPIDAAVAANVLSFGSTSQALADQGVMLEQYISGEAIAHAPQDAVIDQSNDVVDAGNTAPADTATGGSDAATGGSDAATGGTEAPADTGGTAVPAETNGGTNAVEDTSTAITGGSLDGDLLHINVKVDVDADLVAPVAGAVAANANVAAPIDAAVAANVGSFGSDAAAVAEQDAIITQTLDNVKAEATAAQTAEVEQ